MKKETLGELPKVPDLSKPKIGKTDPQDVEMADPESPAVNKEEPKKDEDLLTLEDLRDHIRHVEKAVATKEPRFMSRALRALVPLRRKLNNNVLRRAINGYFTASTSSKDELLAFL